MGLAHRDYMREPTGRRMPAWDWTVRLIILCFAATVLQRALVSWAGFDPVTWFGLGRESLLTGRVWSLATYALLHGDFGHLFWNAFGLWFFGRMVERSLLFGETPWFFLFAAIAGGLGFLIGDVAMGRGAFVIGVSGVLFACLVLAALRFPHTGVRLFFLPFFQIPLWVIAIIWVAGDVLGAVGPPSSGVANWAHLGGAAYGFIVHRVGVVPRWRLKWKRSKSPPRQAQSSPRGASPVPPRPDDEKARVDQLLDKIQREGIGALTTEEREFLNSASKRYR